jgi:hypothetical protein
VSDKPDNVDAGSLLADHACNRKPAGEELYFKDVNWSQSGNPRPNDVPFY